MADPDTRDLPASKQAYSYDATTRELLGTVDVFLSPLEGTYSLPRHVVDLAPPATVGAYQRARLNIEGTAWEIVPDFRRVMLWDTATCSPVPNALALGDALPEGITAEAPPVFSAHEPIANVWDPDAHTWRQVPDYSRTPVWSKATAQRAPSPAPGEPLPDTVTTRMPPRAAVHRTPRWNASLDDWETIADFRGFIYWMPDGTQHTIDQLGVEPPDGHLPAPPDDVAAAPAPTPA